ncbi:MAG: hypothetical protein PUK83_05115 [Clostridia bacterium]|nr:hypothetical protein [Clostridia bacterium]MDY5264346.1 hypothetical protein [Eubacteriales bacterium]MDY5440323.1 hypothetical protein [Eubacteriales bacterium]
MAIEVSIVNEIIDDILPDDDFYFIYNNRMYQVSDLTSSNIVLAKEVTSRFDSENDESKLLDKTEYHFKDIDDFKQNFIVQGKKFIDIMDKLEDIFY